MSHLTNQRNTKHAYLLLVFLILIIALSTNKIVSQLTYLQDQSSSIEKKILEQQTLLNAKIANQNADTNRLSNWVSQGYFLTQVSPAEAAESLQDIAKKALESASANLSLMQPDKQTLDNQDVAHNLELSFNLFPKNFGLMLNQLTLSRPTALVKSLSLRKRQINNGLQLEALVRLSLYSSDRAIKNLPDVQLPSQDYTSENTASAKASPELIGLFNPKYRQRHLSGELTGYRISAISLAETSKTLMLVDEHTKQRIRLTLGDSLNGWTLKNIHAEKAIFTKEKVKVELRLQHEKK